MDSTAIFNAGWMYIFVGVILIACIVQNIIMMRKAWKHAQELGRTNVEIRKGVTNGIIVSIIPTIPVMVVFLTLATLLGAPLPWLRLSVIGSASFESMAAGMGVEAVGETLTVGGFTIKGWLSACWCMTIGASTCIVWSSAALKPISLLYEQAEKVNIKLVMVIGTGCLMGIMAYAAVNFGLSAISTKGVIWLISFAIGFIIILLAKKFPKQRWLNDFLMAIAMILGMVAAMIIFK